MTPPTDFPLEPYEAAQGGFSGDVLAAVLAGLIVAALVGLAAWMWRAAVERERLTRAVDLIWDRIMERAKAALGAGDHEIIGAARALRDAIEAHLGPSLAFAKGAGPSLKSLDQALSGKKEAEAPRKAEEKCVCQGRQPCGCGHGAGASSSAAAAASAGAPVIINVVGGGVGDAARPPASPEPVKAEASKAEAPTPPPPPKTTVDMTAQEQIHAVARAVREFHEWWSQGRSRRAEMRAILNALSTPPPAQGAAHHGGAHGSGTGPRVWDAKRH